MQKIIVINKKIGQTPIDVIKEFKMDHPEYVDEKISYAGRLDPMAEGMLILLIGEENKNRKKHEAMDKEYESEIILGISTDSYDSLGIVEKVNLEYPDEQEIIESLTKFMGKQNQAYPPFSSKPVLGKPLYWWARNKRMNEISVPHKMVEIYNIELMNCKILNAKDFLKELISNLSKVDGEFRQEEIVHEWKNFEEKYSDSQFIKIKIKVTCSSGTYIRGIANDLGKELGSGAFALSIKRIRVGEFNF